jgi:hypothetical protein
VHGNDLLATPPLEATAPLPLGMSIAPRLARLKVTIT